MGFISYLLAQINTLFLFSSTNIDSAVL